MTLNEELHSKRVIVCVGSGGVGKTTIAAALAVSAAKAGRKTLVLTIDPAQRLAQSLGIEKHDKETRVPGQNFKGELWSAMIQSDAVFSEFLRRYASAETVERLEQNSLYRELASTLSGSQEFTSLIKLYECVSSGRYELVILDTPPAAHAMDFLSAPDRIAGLFQNQITRWFAQNSEESGFFSKLFFRSTQAALKVFERITGAHFVQELQEFFKSLKSIQARIAEKSLASKALLLSESTGFVLVTGFDHSKLEEAREFYGQLTTQGYHLSSMIVNRAWPAWYDRLTQPESNALLQSEPSYAEFFKSYCNYLTAKNRMYDEFQVGGLKPIPILRLQDFAVSPMGLEGLLELSSEIENGGVKWKDRSF